MKLALYKTERCPYCRMVMDYLKHAGRADVEFHDINESKADRDFLIREGALRHELMFGQQLLRQTSE